MPPTLEARLRTNAPDRRSDQDRYRSDGERRIAATLEEYVIPFVYEQTIRVQKNGRPKTFRPDFYLPQFDLYIEYFGRVGNPDYDIRTAEKKAVYAANQLNLLPVYPWDLIQDWPNHILDRLRTPPYRRTKTKNLTRHDPAPSPTYRASLRRTRHDYGHLG